MSKISVPIVQFYIDHTCNLTCPNCLSFNNFRVRGRYSWESNRHSVAEWSRRIEVQDLTIIGGEPLLHPEIDLWVSGVRELFPAVEDFKVCTNGTRLGAMRPGVLERWHDLGVILEIHCHSEMTWHTVWRVLRDRFPGIRVQAFVDQPVLHSAEVRAFLGDRLLAYVRKSMNFLPNSIRSTDSGLLEFYDTDPEQSHSSCEIRDCFYIVDGLMYKCGVIAAGATAGGLAVEPRARQLFDSYRPVDPGDPDLEQRIRALANPVPQCRLCPVFGSVRDPAAVVDLVLPVTKPGLSG